MKSDSAKDMTSVRPEIRLLLMFKTRKVAFQSIELINEEDALSKNR